MKQQKEYQLQKQVCEYLRTAYPEVLFMSDTIASVKLTPMQGARNKAIQKEGFKTPDLIIFEPNQYYRGLLIELKIISPWKKNGELKKSEHLKGQWETMYKLRSKRYFATFATGFEEAKHIIDLYMNQR